MTPAPPHSAPPRVRAALAAACAYAVGAALLRLGIHTVFSPFREAGAYRLGVVEGLPFAFGVGVVFALPVFAGPSRRGWACWGILTTIALIGVAIAAHYHVVFNTLPDTSLVANALRPELWGSLHATLPPAVLVAEVLPALVVASAVAAGLWSLLSDVRRARALVATMCVAGALVFVRGAEAQRAVGRADVWWWFATVAQAPPSAARWEGTTAEAFEQVGAALGWPAGIGASPDFPLCVPRTPAGPGIAAGRDVILVVFEGLSNRELDLSIDGVRVCGAIEDALDEGLRFPNVVSGGAQTASVLESMYAGLPPNPHRIMLQHAPVPNVDGFPAAFRRAGYRTGYFHGANLSFENKRGFMGQVGFEALEEPTAGARFEGDAWGEHDAATYARLERWIEARRAAGERFFAAMTTLSAHHPYVVPRTFAERLLPAETEWGELVNAYRYTDVAFSAFYAWYRERELPRGTLLVLSGEHCPRLPYPDDPADTSTGMFEFRFEIPLAVIGLPDADVARLGEPARRPLAQYDVGPTLLGLLGIAPPACGVGQDMLASVAPTARLLPAHAGHLPYFLYFHGDAIRWMYDIRADRMRAFNADIDPTFRRDLAALHADTERMRGLALAYLEVTRALDAQGDRAPAQRAVAERSAITAPAASEVYRSITLRRPGVAHGVGVVSWATAQADPVWIQVRAYATRDGILVLSSGQRISGGDGDDFVNRFSLAEIRALTNVHVPTVREVVDALPAGSRLLVRVDRQVDPRFEFGSLGDLRALAEAARVRGVRVTLRTNSTTLAGEAHRLPGVPMFWALGTDVALDDASVRYALGLGLAGVVLGAEATGADVQRAFEAGLQVIVEDARDLAPAPTAVVLSAAEAVVPPPEPADRRGRTAGGEGGSGD